MEGRFCLYTNYFRGQRICDEVYEPRPASLSTVESTVDRRLSRNLPSSEYVWVGCGSHTWSILGSIQSVGLLHPPPPAG